MGEELTQELFSRVWHGYGTRQKLTEEEYNARFAQADERYARMLSILRAALVRKTT